MKRLPHLGLDNQRKDYSRGVLNAQLNALRQAIGQALPKETFGRLGELGVVDPARVRREIEAVPTCGYSRLVRMYALLSAERWVGVHARV